MTYTDAQKDAIVKAAREARDLLNHKENREDAPTAMCRAGLRILDTALNPGPLPTDEELWEMYKEGDGIIVPLRAVFARGLRLAADQMVTAPRGEAIFSRSNYEATLRAWADELESR